MSIRQQTPLQEKYYEVIFGTDTPAGKWFDIGLILVIIASVIVIMLDSVSNEHARLYLGLEWWFTVLDLQRKCMRLNTKVDTVTDVEDEISSDEFDYMTDDRVEDEWPFGIPHDVLMELIGKDG